MSGRRPKRKAAVAALESLASMHTLEYQQDSMSQPITPIIHPLPHDISTTILEFLSKPELVHHVSLVSLAWCRATRNPALWPALEAETWKKYHGSGTTLLPSKMVFSSMQQFFVFLRRPQFSRLRKLVPPDIYRTLHRNVFDRISASCPYLEDLDLSGRNSIRLNALIAYNEELPRLPDLFPNLKKLRLTMSHAKAETLAEFCRRLGERLTELSIFVELDGDHLVDDTFQVIAASCPNLEMFVYDSQCRPSSAGQLSEQGPIALIQNCPKLKVLSVTVPLVACPHIDRYVEENGHSSRLKLSLMYPTPDDEDDSDSD